MRGWETLRKEFECHRMSLREHCGVPVARGTRDKEITGALQGVGNPHHRDTAVSQDVKDPPNRTLNVPSNGIPKSIPGCCWMWVTPPRDLRVPPNPRVPVKRRGGAVNTLQVRGQPGHGGTKPCWPSWPRCPRRPQGPPCCSQYPRWPPWCLLLDAFRGRLDDLSRQCHHLGLGTGQIGTLLP